MHVIPHRLCRACPFRRTSHRCRCVELIADHPNSQSRPCARRRDVLPVVHPTAPYHEFDLWMRELNRARQNRHQNRMLVEFCRPPSLGQNCRRAPAATRSFVARSISVKQRVVRSEQRDGDDVAIARERVDTDSAVPRFRQWLAPLSGR